MREHNEEAPIQHLITCSFLATRCGWEDLTGPFATTMAPGSNTLPKDGLIDGPITTILKDRNGALWFAGQHRGKSGAVRYDRNAWRIFTDSDGLVGDNIANGLATDNGDVWFGTFSQSTAHRFINRRRGTS